ncbi:TPA: DUF551 domain-containing protein [Serratia marcescens]
MDVGFMRPLLVWRGYWIDEGYVMSEWIKCEDRLPVDDGRSSEYLVYEILNNRVQHDYWNSWCDVDREVMPPTWDRFGNYVTHWMPLPEPPAD